MSQKSLFRRAIRNLDIVIFIAGLLAVWELISGNLIASVLLPPPSEIINFLFTPITMKCLYETVFVIVVGFPISVALGLIVALLVVYYSSLYRVAYPIFFALQSVPSTGLAIIFVIWIGAGFLIKLLLVIYTVFFPVLVNTIGGLTRVKYEYVEMMESIQASKWHTFKKLRFPNALPNIASGLKVAAPNTVIGVVIAELFAGNTGLGYLVISSSSKMIMPLLFSALVWMGVIGVILYGLIIMVEKLTRPWYLRGLK